MRVEDATPQGAVMEIDSPELGGSYDLLVIGAGPAGCVIASRFSEDPERRVLLLEAGPDYGPDPAAWPRDLRDPDDVPADSHPWGYQDEGRPGGSPLALPRARVMGGCSTNNACTWIRGSGADYDAWAADGNPGWAFEDLLPMFRRCEADEVGGTLHGSGGPIPISRVVAGAWTPLDRAFVDAARATGFPFVDDLNGMVDQEPAIGPRPQNVADDTRMNAAFTYLASARARPNLTVRPDSLVDRVLIEDGRATGAVTADGRSWTATEVVVCAGAYGTPAILMRSGIGPARQLRALGIPVVADRPGVGDHLLDHPLVMGALGPFVVARGQEPAASRAPFLPVMLRASGRSAANGIDLNVFIPQWPDESGDRWISQPLVALMDARSTGSVRLTSVDPEAELEIRHAHLSDPEDLEAMCGGVELVARLLSSEPLAKVLEPLPDALVDWPDRVRLAAWLRANVGTMFHPCGTCRMGQSTDPLSVVDTFGRVYGVDGLSVADASIFPSAPRAAIHPSVVAAAERLADLYLIDATGASGDS